MNLKQGYNGDLTAREAGSIGGQMVKNVTPVRTVTIWRNNRTAQEHGVLITYRVSLRIE